jgi:hypothetical protein
LEPGKCFNQKFDKDEKEIYKNDKK